MVITDQFIYLHMPKTGGTFVEKVLKRLLEGKGGLYLDTQIVTGRQHENIRDVPPVYADKKILFTIRNPYDYYVSRYEYNWKYKVNHVLDVEQMKAHYPHYPRLSFAEYLEAVNNWKLMVIKKREDRPYDARMFTEANLGNMTWFFMQFIFRDHWKIIAGLDEYMQNGRHHDELPDVHFLRMEHLNRDLYDYLLSLGYSQSELDFILALGKIYPPDGGRDEKKKWADYYTPELRQMVREKDRFMFHLFPFYDVD